MSQQFHIRRSRSCSMPFATLFAAVSMGATGVMASPGAAQEHTVIEPVAHDDSVVVVSRETATRDGWAQVVSALRCFHRDRGVRTLVFDSSPLELLDQLRELHPRYLVLVARPEELGRPVLLDLHRVVRGLDEDPWPDLEWGVVTGRDWSDAMRQVTTRSPLSIRRAAGVASMPVDAFDEVWCWDESVPGRSLRTSPDGVLEETVTEAADMMPGIVESLNEYQPDLFFSSGRATQDDWRIGYLFNGGAFKVRDGILTGVDLGHRDHPVHSTNPKVWLAAGNCLVGDIADRDSMALAILGSAGATQFLGYTGRTWHGRAGWGASEWYLSNPQRPTLPEAVFFNQVQLTDELAGLGGDLADLDLGTFGPREDPRFREELAAHLRGRLDEEAFERAVGHLWDRDALVLYGDPTWEARRAGPDRPWSFELHPLPGDRWRLTLTVDSDVDTPVPPVLRLPFRMELDPEAPSVPEVLVADDFVMFRSLRSLQAGDSHSVVIHGTPARFGTRVVRPVDGERAERQLRRLPRRYREVVRGQLDRAGARAGELVCAIERLDGELELTSIAFLLAGMPESDLRDLDCGFLVEEVRTASRIRELSRFGRALPLEVHLNEVLPYAFVGERRESWRGPLHERFWPLVRDASSQEQAVRILNRELWRSYGIVYHPSKRPRTDQSPSETVDCGVASCTGLSIILASTLRSVGIPARLAGVPMWHDGSGNHTWVEVWDDGRWHHVEAFGGDGYDDAWWRQRASLAREDDPDRAVWATSWRPTGRNMPLAWDPGDTSVSGINVTRRYLAP